MALDLAGLMTVIGEHVKKVNTFETLITSLETYKDDIYTDLAAEGLQDQYVNLPAQFLAMKSAVSGWISTLISDVTAVLQDPDYVLDELPIYNYDVTSVLNGLYDYMDDNSETIKSSVVSLGGSDTTQNASADDDPTAAFSTPRLFVCRTLDGVNSPGNNVTAHIRYVGEESQLARSGTIYAELISNSTIGSESAQIYSELPVQTPYGTSPESPGKGPILLNPEASNKVPSNPNFSAWSGDAPTGWTMSGTITTDYADASGGGNGPLRFKTDTTNKGSDVQAIQLLSNIAHNTMYFVGAYFKNVSGNTDNSTLRIRLRNLAGSTLGAGPWTAVVDATSPISNVAYGFTYLPESVDLTDVYVEVNFLSSDDSSNDIDVYKVVVSPATYFNGLAWTWWPVYHVSSNSSYVPDGHRTSIAVANNNAGKGQTFFRKAYNIQLPTADSPTQADSLFGG